MSYEKKLLMMPHKFCVNTCPHCGQRFVILAEWDLDVVEQVGPMIYCYICGKRFNDALETHTTPKA